jgi:hypothetical protein
VNHPINIRPPTPFSCDLPGNIYFFKVPRIRPYVLKHLSPRSHSYWKQPSRNHHSWACRTTSICGAATFKSSRINLDTFILVGTFFQQSRCCERTVNIPLQGPYSRAIPSTNLQGSSS